MGGGGGASRAGGIDPHSNEQTWDFRDQYRPAPSSRSVGGAAAAPQPSRSSLARAAPGAPPDPKSNVQTFDIFAGGGSPAPYRAEAPPRAAPAARAGAGGGMHDRPAWNDDWSGQQRGGGGGDVHEVGGQRVRISEQPFSSGQPRQQRPSGPPAPAPAPAPAAPPRTVRAGGAGGGGGGGIGRSNDTSHGMRAAMGGGGVVHF
eukprot:TRINITY_DN4220_c0_g2_i1.p3 TRINITY_DN4220_c0_g2~~TRINITY_DN4220_c0_g2_i1.p3  ORF type:complete len:236 (+),score=49.46 TRINITY_DN4220_c0_g2_i1:102-710(+)